MAPIILFVYKRPDTTSQTLQSLLRNPECSDSELYVFMDGAKGAADAAGVAATRALFDHLQGFAQLHIYPAPKNCGLAQSVISGVSQVLSQHPSAIVLEDDLVVTPDFLHFMNEALATYQSRPDIWSISGYTPHLDLSHTNLAYHDSQVFLAPRAQCWGWATWSDRWQKVDWDVSDYSRMRSRQERQAFNRGGDDLSRTLDMERHGKIESWAIRWAYAAYRNHCWTLNPVGSKTQNIGFEDGASHQGWHDSRHRVTLYQGPVSCDPAVQPDPQLCTAFKAHHDLGPISKVGYFLRRHDLGYKTLKRLLHR